MRFRSATLLILLASSMAFAAPPAGKGTATPTTTSLGKPAATPAGPVQTPPPNPNAPKPQVNEKGFPVPDLTGFEKLPYPKSGALQGGETIVDTFQNARGDQVMKMSLHGVTYAFGVLPAGDASKGYLLLDPKCEKKLTMKFAPDAAFEPPACAVMAKKPAPAPH